MLEGVWYVSASFGHKEGFTTLFLSLLPDTPPTELSGDLGFVSEVNQMGTRSILLIHLKWQMITS